MQFVNFKLSIRILSPLRIELNEVPGTVPFDVVHELPVEGVESDFLRYYCTSLLLFFSLPTVRSPHVRSKK